MSNRICLRSGRVVEPVVAMIKELQDKPESGLWESVRHSIGSQGSADPHNVAIGAHGRNERKVRGKTLLSEVSGQNPNCPYPEGANGSGASCPSGRLTC